MLLRVVFSNSPLRCLSCCALSSDWKSQILWLKLTDHILVLARLKCTLRKKCESWTLSLSPLFKGMKTFCCALVLFSSLKIYVFCEERQLYLWLCFTLSYLFSVLQPRPILLLLFSYGWRDTGLWQSRTAHLDSQFPVCALESEGQPQRSAGLIKQEQKHTGTQTEKQAMVGNSLVSEVKTTRKCLNEIWKLKNLFQKARWMFGLKREGNRIGQDHLLFST